MGRERGTEGSDARKTTQDRGKSDGERHSEGDDRVGERRDRRDACLDVRGPPAALTKAGARHDWAARRQSPAGAPKQRRPRRACESAGQFARGAGAVGVAVSVSLSGWKAFSCYVRDGAPQCSAPRRRSHLLLLRDRRRWTQAAVGRSGARPQLRARVSVHLPRDSRVPQRHNHPGTPITVVN